MSKSTKGQHKINRVEISKFTGWVTVDEAKGMIRKNAPETEIGQQRLTYVQKLSNRPSWMTERLLELLKREKPEKV